MRSVRKQGLGKAGEREMTNGRLILVAALLLLCACAGPSADSSPAPPAVVVPVDVAAESLPADRYLWTSKWDHIGPEFAGRGFSVMEVSGGYVQLTGTVPFLSSPDGSSEARIDQRGSRDVSLGIDPAVGVTHFAGLAFTSPCGVAILADGTLLADRTGIVAVDGTGARWASAALTAGTAIVFPFSPVR